MSWNVGGINDKLDNNYFIQYISRFDVIGLQETWVNGSTGLYNVLQNYTSFVCEAKRSKHGGRNLGGVFVFIRNCFLEFIERIFEDFEYGVVLILKKESFNFDKDVFFVSLYFPPTGSAFYTEGVRNGLSVLDNLLCDNNFDMTKYSLLLSGDFNARTGSLDDFLSFPELPEFEHLDDFFSNDICIKRAACDTHINGFGKDLITFCQTNSLSIVNGRLFDDKGVGVFTF